MPKDYVCRVICHTDELEEFRASWRALWAEDSNATPFQSPEWLLPWWHQFGSPELRAVVISHGGKPIGFLPFYIYCEPNRRELQLLLMGAGTTDYLDGVFAPQCKVEHVRMALEVLEESPGWDVMHAVQLRKGSLLFRALKEASEWNPQSFATDACSQMRAVPISQLPVKIRRNAMYYRNRAMRAGELELSLADDESWPAFFDALVRLHTTRWQQNGELGVLADPRVLACHREAIPQLLRRGMLQLYSLLLNGDVLGVAYSLTDPAARANGTLYIYLAAHSIEHASLRPGTLLLAAVTERAAEEGIQTIDLLRGQESYKKLWHVESVPTFGFAVDHRAISMERRLLSA